MAADETYGDWWFDDKINKLFFNVIKKLADKTQQRTVI